MLSSKRVRKKKEKSVEKENNSCNSNSNSTAAKSNVGKKLSVDNSSEAEVLEEVEEEEEEEEAPTTNILEKVYLEYCSLSETLLFLQVPLVEEERRAKGSPASLASCGRANSAPSNDSGHVSAEPYSLPSVSSTKVSITSE